MYTKYAINDILLYNSQGTITTGIIVKIIVVSDGTIYQMDTNDAIREDIVISLLGNAEVLSDDFYKEKKCT